MTDHVHGPDCAQGHGAPVKLGAVGGKEPCPCGSGKKYKHCCYRKDVEEGAAVATSAIAAPVTEAKADAAESDTEAGAEAAPDREHGKPKAPTIARGTVMPPRKPPLGASKALNRRSGHR